MKRRSQARRDYLPGLPSPPVRATCAHGPRPCPWISCRHRMAPAAPAKWIIPAPTCALDVAELVEAGAPGPTFDVIGHWLGVTRGRVLQIESKAMRKAGSTLRELDAELPELPDKRPTVVTDARRHEDAIVSALRAQRDWVEIDVLAERTGLARDSVRRAIGRLRGRGVPIESRLRRGGGYRWAA